MTAILREIRDLEAALNRGDLNQSEYLSRRAALLDSVEIAEPEYSGPPARTPQSSGLSARGSGALGLSLVMALGIMTLCIAATLFLLPDLNLALTLGVTVLAALSVTLLRAPED